MKTINSINVMGCKTPILRLIFFLFGKMRIFARVNSVRMGKGRDKDLVRLRDEALCRRYYQLTEKQRLRFDDALKILSSQEFFISEERIMAIIRRKVGELEGLALRAVPKVKMPKLTARQLELFVEDGEAVD